MSHPGAELQSAIYSALSASTNLANLIGPDRVYDEVPPNQHPPYVTFGKSVHADWSTDTESGMEHEIELHIWTRERGRKEIFLIQGILIDTLTPLQGPMSTHYLINFTHEQSEIEARDKYQAFIGITVFRGVTEPII